MITTDWRQEGVALIRDLTFRDFDEALSFVEEVGAAAVDYLRRPDMCTSEFTRVRLTIINPHDAGITPAERRLMRKVDAIVDRRAAAA